MHQLRNQICDLKIQSLEFPFEKQKLEIRKTKSKVKTQKQDLKSLKKSNHKHQFKEVK